MAHCGDNELLVVGSAGGFGLTPQTAQNDAQARATKAFQQAMADPLTCPEQCPKRTVTPVGQPQTTIPKPPVPKILGYILWLPIFGFEAAYTIYQNVIVTCEPVNVQG
jgi:hypothetical protein